MPAEVSQVRRALDAVSRGLPERRESLAKLEARYEKQREEAAARAAEKDKMARTSVPGNVPSGWPTSGDISSPFGWRWNGTDFHPGIDIANDMGTPIVATADGVVTTAGWNGGGYGNMVDIDHGSGVSTRYGHASGRSMAASASPSGRITSSTAATRSSPTVSWGATTLS